MIQCDPAADESRSQYLYDLHGRMETAIDTGDQPGLQTLLDEWSRAGRDQDIVDNCLILAVAADQPGSVRQLMACGARADGSAVERGVEGRVSTDVWQALLDHGWDVDSHSMSGRPVICDFMTGPAIDPVLTWFLSHGASLEARSRDDLNPLSVAAGYKPVPVLRCLLEHARASGDIGDLLTRCNALHQAAFARHADRTPAMALLVDEFGADVHAIGGTVHRKAMNVSQRATPLHMAVRSGRREHVRFLLERGAKVAAKDVQGRDVREYARQVNCPEGWGAVKEWCTEKGVELPRGKEEQEAGEGGETMEREGDK